jgi:carbamate kinase
MNVREAKKYLDEGHFPAGSMGPKVQAAVNFVNSGKEKAIITSIEKLIQAIEGKTGTHIYSK